VRNRQELTLNVTLERESSGELGPKRIKVVPSPGARPKAVRVQFLPTL
jgi:hypothetical protein